MIICEIRVLILLFSLMRACPNSIFYSIMGAFHRRTNSPNLLYKPCLSGFLTVRLDLPSNLLRLRHLL